MYLSKNAYKENNFPYVSLGPKWYRIEARAVDGCIPLTPVNQLSLLTL